MIKDKKYYLGLDYSVLIDEINDDGEVLFTASIRELPGLIVYGDSLNEVYEEIELAKADWIEANLEWGREIEEPFKDSLEEYSGKVTLRMPKTLHRKVKERSEIEGVSLNQTLVQLINDGLFNDMQSSIEQLAKQIENTTKQFSQTIEEKVAAPEQHFYYTLENQSKKTSPYKEQVVLDSGLQFQRIFSGLLEANK
ncbi:toxin-antitoxin system HicB family antitoxin [Streptococcus danieliae]|uniref:Toxin-antitoxin system HicB family antitoxin n=1 Tax=Streptococcus danieliae TaxID=747656 RepID=A0A7X3G6X1_9STRE|nr:toxin-antitoxin system HicB family antitoxin [Streptococcus danieliae]MVX58259.1 toxin-antitoxin system HicB family antitoxin [Streptococcus danieliae]